MHLAVLAFSTQLQHTVSGRDNKFDLQPLCRGTSTWKCLSRSLRETDLASCLCRGTSTWKCLSRSLRETDLASCLCRGTSTWKCLSRSLRETDLASCLCQVLARGSAWADSYVKQTSPVVCVRYLHVEVPEQIPRWNRPRQLFLSGYLHVKVPEQIPRWNRPRQLSLSGYLHVEVPEQIPTWNRPR